MIEYGTLSKDTGAVLKLRLKVNILFRDRQHPASNGQHLPHLPYRLSKAAIDPVQGCHHEVAEVLPLQGSLLKTVGHQPFHDRLRVGKGQHAVPGISRRQHAKILPEHAAPAAVIGHGDNGRDVPGVAFEPPQHGRKAMSASNGDDTRCAAGGIKSNFLLLMEVLPIIHGQCPGGLPR